MAEALWPREVYLRPIILGLPGHKGGRTNYARVKKDLLRQLKQDPNAYCSTMIDFYALGEGFPATPLPFGMRQIDKVLLIERAILEDISATIPEFRPDLRLIPYLCLHEFEALLFSDVAAFAGALRRPELASSLQRARADFATPEDINEGTDTAPSKRIAAICPSYRKVIDGTLAAAAIGIARCGANARISKAGSSASSRCQNSDSGSQMPSKNRSTQVLR